MPDVQLPDVKRGDAATLTLTLAADDALPDYDTAVVLLRRMGEDAYELDATIDTGVVTCDLPDTLPVGDYRGEVECAPGLHTYPSNGYFLLSIKADLNPS